MLTLEQGTKIVRIAREKLDEFVLRKDRSVKEYREDFLNEKRGAFVTLNKVTNGERELRGCIGFPYPVKKLYQAVQEACIASASEDPRFEPVRKEELESIIVEVSVLTNPEEVLVNERRELPRKIEIGKDGLIVTNGPYSGLLLPQVATEYSMDAETFLSEACMKAGLMPDSWLLKETKVYKFQAEVFSELSPRGRVEKLES